MVAQMIGQMPAEVLAQMKARGMDPSAAFREAAEQGLDGTVEFLPTGVVRTTRRLGR